MRTLSIAFVLSICTVNTLLANSFDAEVKQVKQNSFDAEVGQVKQLIQKTFEPASYKGLPFLAITGDENDIADSNDFKRFVQPRADRICKHFGYAGADKVLESYVHYNDISSFDAWDLNDNLSLFKTHQEYEYDAFWNTIATIATAGAVIIMGHSPAYFKKLTCFKYQN